MCVGGGGGAWCLNLHLIPYIGYCAYFNKGSGEAACWSPIDENETKTS